MASFSTNLLIIWAISCYVLFTLIAQKEQRYIIYWIPALTGLAAVGLIQGVNFIIQRIDRLKLVVRFSIISPVILIVLLQALLLEQPYINGYNKVANFVLSQRTIKRNEIIFYDGNDHGSFTFAVRKHDPQRRVFLFRSSKYLSTLNMKPGIFETVEKIY